VISLVNLVETSTVLGSTSECAGIKRTSSKVRPSIIGDLVKVSILHLKFGKYNHFFTDTTNLQPLNWSSPTTSAFVLQNSTAPRSTQSTIAQSLARLSCLLRHAGQTRNTLVYRRLCGTALTLSKVIFRNRSI